VTSLLALVLVCVGCNTTAQLCLRVGALAAVRDGGWLAARSCTPIAAGLGLWGVSTVLWILVLSRTELAYAQAFASLTYVLVPCAACALLGEAMPPVRVAGLACIVAGVILVAVGGPPPGGTPLRASP